MIKENVTRLNPSLATSSIERKKVIEEFLHNHILRFWDVRNPIQKDNPWPCFEEEGYFKEVTSGDTKHYLVPFYQLASWMGCEVWMDTRGKLRRKIYSDNQIQPLLFRITENSERIRVAETLGMHRYARMTGSINLYTPDAVWYMFTHYSDVGYNDTPETFRRILKVR
jgi:hypothetical protein